MMTQLATSMLAELVAAELVADLRRVTLDLINEHRDPSKYDVGGIAVDMRKLAGDQHLDSVSDQAWSELIEWHRQSPWPVEVSA